VEIPSNVATVSDFPVFLETFSRAAAGLSNALPQNERIGNA